MDNTNKKKVGKEIRKIRLEKGMTMQEFGKLFGVSKSSVSMWENGKSIPSPDRLKQIAKIGNTSVNYILSSSDSENVALSEKLSSDEKAKTFEPPEYTKSSKLRDLVFEIVSSRIDELLENIEQLESSNKVKLDNANNLIELSKQLKTIEELEARIEEQEKTIKELQGYNEILLKKSKDNK